MIKKILDIENTREVQKINPKDSQEKTTNLEQQKRRRNSQANDAKKHHEKLKEVETLLMKVDDLWKCKRCNKPFPDRSRLRKHAELHVTGLAFPCNQCSKNFPTRMRLGHHKQSNHKI